MNLIHVEAVKKNMAQDPGKLEIAIIGAGIAGLAAAIALTDHPGISVRIFEQADRLREIGASIALGPNGMRTLERLGVTNALDDSVAFRNTSGHPMIYRHYKTNEIVSVDSHRGRVDYRHRTSRFYRPHLQQALLNHLNPSIIHLNKGFKAVSFNPDLQKLVITFTDGTAASADILLGADGIHSPVRTFFVPTSSTAWTGGVTLRSVFPVSRLSDANVEVPDEATHYWGPGRTFFVSRLGRDLFTIVGSYQDDPDALDAPYKNATWNSDGDVKVLRAYYKDWSPLVRGIVEATPHVRLYPNTMAHALDTWLFRCTDGGGTRITLAGDAAHAHGGAFAAGGSLALDDAWAFASSIRHVFLRDKKSDSTPLEERIELALKLYENTRKAHTDRLMKVVHDGNKKRVGKIEKVETDEELRARMKSRGDTSWMHEHDVVAEFQKAVYDNLEGGTDARL